MNDGTYRDSSGRSLSDYPRPSVAVDTAVLTLDPDLGLVVLEVRRPAGTGWALPGTFLHEGETLADAVDRSLRVKANVRRTASAPVARLRRPGPRRSWLGAIGRPRRSGASGTSWRRASSRRPGSYRSMPRGGCPTTTSSIIARAVEHIRSNYLEQARSRSSARRRVHPSRVADRARGRSRPRPAARHVPSGDGTAPRRDGRHDDRHQGTAGGAVPSTRAVESAAQATAVTRRTTALLCRQRRDGEP